MFSIFGPTGREFKGTLEQLRQVRQVPATDRTRAIEPTLRDGMLYASNPFVTLLPGETIRSEIVRFRTIGDMSCTGAVASTADTLEDVVAEIAATRITERGETRADDRASEAAMEDRKRVGYF